jgi:hypothetical protein
MLRSGCRNSIDSTSRQNSGYGSNSLQFNRNSYQLDDSAYAKPYGVELEGKVLFLLRWHDSPVFHLVLLETTRNLRLELPGD